ncbi:MAG: hypothetical protein Q8R96_03535, partial [Bacteroidota bacterium]|nr:hypothetical protein [Bacteroidota bacterium]
SSWELRKHDDDVFIYQRWVEAEPGRKARELYAEILVAAKPEALTQIICDEKYGTKCRQNKCWQQDFWLSG